MLIRGRHYARLMIFSLLCLPAAGPLAAQDRHTGIVITSRREKVTEAGKLALPNSTQTDTVRRWTPGTVLITPPPRC